MIARNAVNAPIVSATGTEQVESFAKAVTLKLSAEDMVRLEKASA